MHMVQNSICASGLEIKQVQLRPGHLQGERESPQHYLIHSYSTWAQQAWPDGLSHPLEGSVSPYPETAMVTKLTMAGGKRVGFLLENTRCSTSNGLQVYMKNILISSGESGKTHPSSL